MNKSKILAFIVLSALVLSLFYSSLMMKAKAVDLNSDISLTVDVWDGFAEVDKTKVIVDLYKIAQADPVDGYDTYELTLVGAYTGLNLNQVNAAGSTDWKKIQSDAANIALKKGELQKPMFSGPLGKQILTQKGEVGGPGLYLVVAHGEGEYIEYPETADGEITTLVDGTKQKFHFEPQLIAIPNRLNKADPPVSNTANVDTPWQYDVSVVLKGTPEQELGNLRIVKTLSAPDGVQIRPCTVTFLVTGVYRGEVAYEKDGIIYTDKDPADKYIYQKVHSINFNGNTSGYVEIKGLPCDTDVTISEIYAGAGYACIEPEGGVGYCTIVPEDQQQTVEIVFQNILRNSRFGVGIINHFEYDEESDSWSVSTPDSN